MSKIAVIGILGESVFLTLNEFGKIGETAVATDIHRELGGKGFNQAVAIARSGVLCSYLCAVNEDDVPAFSGVAEKIGIKPCFVPKSEQSPYAVITTDKTGDNCVCVYRGAELCASDVDGFADEIKSADILLISNEVPTEVNERAVDIARANGVKVILNPAPARPHTTDFLKKIDFFTPNEHELSAISGFENTVVTLGERGCRIVITGEVIPPVKIQTVVDTTGAGDTFNGVLAAYLANGAELREACIRANFAAALKVSRRYILDSIPTKEEIDKFEREYENG
jgi:ribokinase